MSKNINQLIINWYKENKRDLPWRNTTDPYKIWVSEIILQQTRVQQGWSYYNRFMEHFPSVKHLASADEQMVLQLWQGLGYYSRARNLHKTAKIICSEKKGKFPSSYHEIIKLPGIGDYTASAISSFSFNEVQAVLDGNVCRVLSRIFDWKTPIDTSKGKSEFREMAQDFLAKDDPATHNQSIMEFGALQCTPHAPNCEVCPVQVHCRSFSLKTVTERPVKSKRTKVKNRTFHYFLVRYKDEILLQKRSKKDIWQHLFQLPLWEASESNENKGKEEMTKLFGAENVISDICEPLTHLLSHQKLTIHFHQIDLLEKKESNEYIWVKKSELEQFPFPKPLVDFLASYGK